MYNNIIPTFYHENMSINTDSYSKSPSKPKLFLDFIKKHNLSDLFPIIYTWKPYKQKDFLLAHTTEYVNSFFNGIKPLCETNGITWSKEFVESVCYTNSSLYNAIKYAIVNEGHYITFSPTSGFHHATPNMGSGFCTFSGQVIASLKIYREYGLSGAYIDLDGHFGNSIEDSRKFNADINKAIPIGCNINPSGSKQTYIKNLKAELQALENKILNNEIHYLVFCHGADSHEWDDLSGQLNTDDWLLCSRIVYNFVNNINIKTGKKIPLTLALFGGYRNDDFNSVLGLHFMDVMTCLDVLCGEDISVWLQQNNIKKRLSVKMIV